MPTYRHLLPGDPAPWFQQRSSVNPNYAFNSAAGRYLVLCFFMSAANARARLALEAAVACNARCSTTKRRPFSASVSIPADEQQKRVATKLPGYRYFWDFDRKISKLLWRRAGGCAELPAAPLPRARCGSCSIRRCGS